MARSFTLMFSPPKTVALCSTHTVDSIVFAFPQFFPFFSFLYLNCAAISQKMLSEKRKKKEHGGGEEEQEDYAMMNDLGGRHPERERPSKRG